MVFASSPEHRVLARVLLWLAIGDFHHIMKSKSALCQQLVLTCSLQLSISAETIHKASHFKLPLENKTRIPTPSPSPEHGKMPIRVAAL